MTGYMQRKRFFVPKEETDRFYGRQGDPKSSDFTFGHEFEDELEWQ